MLPEWITETFRNASLVWWLPLALLPLVIHLLNRLRRKSVEWAAMRFLLDSYATRSRKILLEEVALLAVRVLLLAGLVMAAARPLLRNPHYGGQARARQDVVIVMDLSSSMALRHEGASQFERACGAAGQVLDLMNQGDTVSVVLAGPVVRTLSARPIFVDDTSRQEMKRSLSLLRPVLGGMDMVRAMDRAQVLLEAGQHQNKHVVIITDGQAAGWRTDQPKRWDFLRQSLEQLPSRPLVSVLTVGRSSGRATNLAVQRVASSRRLVGTDRPVELRVRVANTGTESTAPRNLELIVDEKKVDEQDIGELPPGASDEVAFSHRFARAGSHLVEARLAGADQIDLDDGMWAAMRVIDRLPVLIVDGAPSARPLESETSFLTIALDPKSAEQQGDVDYIVDAQVVELAETESIDPRGSRVVVLANVSRLGEGFLGRLRSFVRDGGGLLIAPGDQTDLDWINDRLLGGDVPLLPCRLEPATVRSDDPEAGQPLAAEVVEHAAAALSTDRDSTDVDQVRAYRWHRLAPPVEGQGRIILRLANGDGVLAERRVGRGRVLLSAVPLDADWTNLPGTKAFVVLAHEMITWLAEPFLSRWNVEPGGEMVARLSREGFPTKARVVEPSGESVEIAGRRDGGDVVFRYDRTEQPGVYRLLVGEAQDEQRYYFTSRCGEEESALARLDESMRQVVSDRLGAAFAENVAAFEDRLQPDRAGTEIWQLLAAGVLVLLLAEVFLTRRIAASRHAARAQGVAFGI